MPYKNFSRRCELCDYEAKNCSNWSKHLLTQKHKRNADIEMEERIRVKVAVEMEKYKLGITADNTATNTACSITNNTTNNTINFDASNNITINVFTPNPDAINLKDLVVPVLKELVAQQITPVDAIKKSVLNMGQQKPILYHNDKMYVKEGKWTEGEEADKQLDLYCRNKQHSYINELNEMDMMEDIDKFSKASELVYEPLDKEAILYKMKSKLNTKMIK